MSFSVAMGPATIAEVRKIIMSSPSNLKPSDLNPLPIILTKAGLDVIIIPITNITNDPTYFVMNLNARR